ncbi:hypothetical protein B9D06_22070, partial [Mycobacterium tuberculosis]
MTLFWACYYGGCEFVDVAESLAIERAKQVFGGDYVNVQPHAGAQAQRGPRVTGRWRTSGDPILGLLLRRLRVCGRRRVARDRARQAGFRWR